MVLPPGPVPSSNNLDFYPPYFWFFFRPLYFFHPLDPSIRHGIFKLDSMYKSSFQYNFCFFLSVWWYFLWYNRRITRRKMYFHYLSPEHFHKFGFLHSSYVHLESTVWSTPNNSLLCSRSHGGMPFALVSPLRFHIVTTFSLSPAEHHTFALVS